MERQVITKRHRATINTDKEGKLQVALLDQGTPMPDETYPIDLGQETDPNSDKPESTEDLLPKVAKDIAATNDEAKKEAINGHDLGDTFFINIKYLN